MSDPLQGRQIGLSLLQIHSRQAGQAEPKAQSCNRAFEVVGDATQHHRTLLLDAPQAPHHGIEAAGELAHGGGATLLRQSGWPGGGAYPAQGPLQLMQGALHLDPEKQQQCHAAAQPQTRQQQPGIGRPAAGRRNRRQQPHRLQRRQQLHPHTPVRQRRRQHGGTGPQLTAELLAEQPSLGSQSRVGGGGGKGPDSQGQATEPGQGRRRQAIEGQLR